MSTAPPLPTLTAEMSPIAHALDALSHEERVNWIRGLGKKQQKALWELAEYSFVDMDFFASEPGVPVVHWGQNSLPLFSTFKKVFLKRTDDEERKHQGYNLNKGLAAWFGGPGHYTCFHNGKTTVIDYTTLPPDAPDAWPRLVDNNTWTRQFVYGGMNDVMRRVSRHVTIGRAWRKGKITGNYFLLCREGEPHDADRYHETAATFCP